MSWQKVIMRPWMYKKSNWQEFEVPFTCVYNPGETAIGIMHTTWCRYFKGNTEKTEEDDKQRHKSQEDLQLKMHLVQQED